MKKRGRLVVPPKEKPLDVKMLGNFNHKVREDILKAFGALIRREADAGAGLSKQAALEEALLDLIVKYAAKK